GRHGDPRPAPRARVLHDVGRRPRAPGDGRRARGGPRVAAPGDRHPGAHEGAPRAAVRAGGCAGWTGPHRAAAPRAPRAGGDVTTTDPFATAGEALSEDPTIALAW